MPKTTLPITTPRPVTGHKETDMAVNQLAVTTLDPLLAAVQQLQAQLAAVQKALT